MSRNHFKITKGVSLSPVISRPSDPENGDMIYNSTNNVFERYENGVWTPFSSSASKTVGARISSAGVVSGESQDFINGNASYSGGTCTITLNSFFNTISSVQCTIIGDVTGGTLGDVSVSSASTSSIVINTSTLAVGNVNRDFYITVTGT